MKTLLGFSGFTCENITEQVTVHSERYRKTLFSSVVDLLSTTSKSIDNNIFKKGIKCLLLSEDNRGDINIVDASTSNSFFADEAFVKFKKKLFFQDNREDEG